MKIVKYLLFVVAIGYFTTVEGKKAYNNFIWAFTNIKIDKYSLSGISYTVTFTGQNNNVFPISLNRYEGKMMYENGVIGDINIPQIAIIEGGKTGNFTFKGTIPTASLGFELINVLKAGKFDKSKLRTKGWFFGKANNIPFAYPINTALLEA